MVTAEANTVPALLVARAASDPEQEALRVGEHGLTYRAWDERSAAVAVKVLDRGLRRGDRVGLVFDGAGWLDFAVTYLGVQRAGGVAVPLGTQAGARTITESFAECGVAGVIVGRGVPKPDVSGWVARAGDLATYIRRAPDVSVAPDDIAQILYTSGTTARAKGVVASHANLTHGLPVDPRRRPLAHSRHCLHAFALGSNAAQTMLIQALVAAPTTIIAEEFEADAFASLIERNRVGSVFVVPAMAIELLARDVFNRYDLARVQLLGSTAAALPPPVALALAEALPHATLTNCYTSTEAAPAQLTMIFDSDRPDALGRPARPDQLRITGPDGRPVPSGETGAVWLRSSAPSRSYRGDPGANERVFADGWIAMGDLGYRDAQGYLHLVDRVDDLINSGALKVSTVRVEAALHEHPSVADVAVVGVAHPALGQVPAAALVAAPGAVSAGTAGLRAFASARLARHEVPAVYRWVDALPRNASGKVRKTELRELLALGEQNPAPAPESATERALAQLWIQVIGASGTDFFALGGDSLRAGQLATLAGEYFGVTVPVSVVFERPDLAGQAAWIDVARAEARPDAVVAGEPAVGQQLSSLQEELLAWMHETEPARDVGPMHVSVRIVEEVDAELLTAAVTELTRRHDALRTRFVADGPGWTAVVLNELPPETVVFEPVGADLGQRRRAATEMVSAEVSRPFAWQHGPLVRFVLARVVPDEWLAALVVHHLVVDGWSMGVLLRELGVLYSALRTGHSPDELRRPVQSGEVIAWHRAQWSRTRPWWTDLLDGAPPAVAHFPGRRGAHSYRAAAHRFQLDGELATAVREQAAALRSTHFVVIAACWLAVLARYSGEQEFVALTPITGRPKPEFESAVGCLAQSLLLRVRVDDDPTLPTLVERVRDALRAATDHRAYPFAEFSVPYPVEIPFSRWAGEPHIPGLLSEPLELPHGLVWRWPLLDEDRGVPKLELAETPSGDIECWLTYNAEAFTVDTVTGLAEELLGDLSAHFPRPKDEA